MVESQDGGIVPLNDVYNRRNQKTYSVNIKLLKDTYGDGKVTGVCFKAQHDIRFDGVVSLVLEGISFQFI